MWEVETKGNSMVWYTNDPRYSINKRDKIVIVDLALEVG